MGGAGGQFAVMVDKTFPECQETAIAGLISIFSGSKFDLCDAKILLELSDRDHLVTETICSRVDT